jgi:hypothetical protein
VAGKDPTSGQGKDEEEGPMLQSFGRRLFGGRYGQRVIAFAVAFLILGAVFGSAAATPRASAQACCWPWQTSFTGYGGWGGWGGYGSWGGYGGWGNGYWGNNWSGYPSSNWWGYNSYPYGNYGYGYGSGYGYGLSSPLFNYGYGNYYSPIYASPGMGSNYFSAYSPLTALSAAQPIQQYQFPASIVGTYLGHQAYTISGQYCKDKSGGMVWINASTAIPDGISCSGPTSTSSSTYAPAGSTQFSTAPASLTGAVTR